MKDDQILAAMGALQDQEIERAATWLRQAGPALTVRIFDVLNGEANESSIPEHFRPVLNTFGMIGLVHVQSLISARDLEGGK